MKLASPLLTALAALLLAPFAQAAEAPAAPAKDDGNPRVELNTSEGAIIVELDRKNAPVSTANFLAYVDAGHYDGTIFHRVIKGFVVQGGGYDIALKEKATKAPIKLEAGLPNVRGSLAMARTNDPNSATSQFYINLVDNKMLDPRGGSPGYAVFGKVVEGMDVVDRIAGHPTKSTYELGTDVPREAITISKAKRLAAQP